MATHAVISEFVADNETGLTDGDGDFSSSDLVVAFQDGGFEARPRLATIAVPEPTALPIVWLLLVGAAITKFRRV